MVQEGIYKLKEVQELVHKYVCVCTYVCLCVVRVCIYAYNV